MNTIDIIKNKFKLEKLGPGTLISGSRNTTLLDLFKELNFTKGAEIGVETGVFSEVICKSNPSLELYAIDPWKAYKGYRDHLNQEYMDNLYQSTKKRLKPYSNCTIIRGYSENVYKKFDDESLDFVYIDGNHDFLHVTQDIAFWSQKVKRGGIVSGHDFRRTKPSTYRTINNVKDVIPSYAYGAGIKEWFILQCSGETANWFWVKP